MMEPVPINNPPAPTGLAIDPVPGLEPLLAFLAGGYLRFGQWRKARILLGVLHGMSPANEDYHIGLGLACLRDGSPEDALAHLDLTVGHRISNDVRSVPFWQALLLCGALKANGMTNEAMAIFSYRLRAQDAPAPEGLP